MHSDAVLSPCRTYRYTLWRSWLGGSGHVMFVGLNPSTADEKLDDPTIRRCMGFAQTWGYAGLCMTNLFAYRATDPADMFAHAQAGGDVIGPENDEWLRDAAGRTSVVVAAWGAHGDFLHRAAAVQKLLLPKLHYLRLTKGGHPGHPLYLPKTLTPVAYPTR